MYNVIVFAGTTEGYEISRFLSQGKVAVCACVATEYGSRSLEKNEYLEVKAQRLDQGQMEALIEAHQPELVLDATHPYAFDVTENIRRACENTGTEYLRILRAEGTLTDSEVYVADVEEAVSWLEHTEGNILLTTGSKELARFKRLKNYPERLYARVLSLPSVLEACREMGLEGRHLIGMQGPFSTELNEAMLRQYDCRYLVTKNSGKAGGFEEKLQAAKNVGAVTVVIGRPSRETGLSLREAKKLLAERFGFAVRPQVTLLGIGMGARETLTKEGEAVLEQSSLLIGAKRIVDSVKLAQHRVEYEYRSEEIARLIAQNADSEKIAVVLSGDVGFYSGARKLTELLSRSCDLRMVCGISSVVYFMAKIGLSWDDAKIVSAHGRDCNLISCIRCHPKVFSIMGTTDGIGRLAEKLCQYEMGHVRLYVGENLSYPEENIFSASAAQLVGYQGDALCVVCAVNEAAAAQNAVHGIRDRAFIRGKAPMTKEEVRTVSLAKLELKEDSICYDVGAGTGSVSVEMALRAWKGRVYAIEKKADALELLQKNKIRFGADNLEIVSGTAPDAMEDLPAPTHAFIGGSSGNLKAIVNLLLNKNPQVKIVINCITLETVAEALQLIRERSMETSEIVQLCVSRSKNIADYHMMMGENPIYIITLNEGVQKI